MWREKQISLTANLVRVVSYFSLGLVLVRVCQRTWPLKAVYRSALGYRRPFASLKEANEAVLPFARSGHENSHNVQRHFELSTRARPSDYAAFFHLQPIVSSLHTVFDLGGNAGNLFYSYSQYLTWPSDLIWLVKDLPGNMAAGETIAIKREAQALRFTPDWSQAGNVDLLIVSGSMHYLDKPLAQMIAELAKRPSYLLINRSPLTDGVPVATIQDTGYFKVACMLHNRLELIHELERLDYAVVDQWEAAELTLQIPGYPEHRIRTYSGMFLRLKREQSDHERLGVENSVDAAN